MEPYRRFPSRGGYRTSYRAAGSFYRPRGRGFSRRSTARGRGNTQSYASVSVAPVTSKGNSRRLLSPRYRRSVSGSRGRAFCFIPQCVDRHHSGCCFVLSFFFHGFHISFSIYFPGFFRLVAVVPRNYKALLSIQAEIRNLASLYAIVQINDFLYLCLSPIFYLLQINLFPPVQYFRMESLSVIFPQLSLQDWAATLDL